MIFSAKTGANPESSVGLMSMGGNTPEILTTLTTDIGKVLDGLHRTKIKGSSHFVTGINVAAVRWSMVLGDVIANTKGAVGSKAQAKQVAEAEDSHIQLQSHRRRREEPDQVGEEDEEEWYQYRHHRVRRT